MWRRIIIQSRNLPFKHTAVRIHVTPSTTSVITLEVIGCFNKAAVVSGALALRLCSE
jgi:hypothetical protein